ncbi:MAG TPA: DUF3108 domain-containing protein [Opitutaceae bacterium]|nr:DUF3108 domain-containing protein [Opitutaceae bacterium]
MMRVCLSLLALVSAAHAAPAFPLEDGEHLSYRVSWAVVMGAGEIKIDAQRDTASAEPRLKVITTTATRRLARLLLPFDARSESVFDLTTGKLLTLHETSATRSKKTDHTVIFDYATHTASYTTPADTAGPRAFPIPEGDPMDLIMGLLQTRTWDMKPGDARDALVLFDDDFYQLTIHAIRYEEVHTTLGAFNTLLLEPRMEKTDAKGMFKRGSTVRVWIAQDSHHLPVRFEVEFKIGTGTATLESYQGPTSAAPDAKDSRP